MVGDTYTILVSGKDTAGRHALIDMLIPAGGGPPPHRHDFEEMFHVLDGEIEVRFRGETATVRSGETANVPANAPHSFRNATDRRCACCALSRRSAWRSSSQRSATRSPAGPHPLPISTKPLSRHG